MIRGAAGNLRAVPLDPNKVRAMSFLPHIFLLLMGGLSLAAFLTGTIT